MPKKGKAKSRPARPADSGAVKKEAEVAPHRQLYVGNLPLGEMTDQRLWDLFCACGEVQAADVHNTAKHSFGFVTFRTVADASRAIELLNGRDEMAVRYSSNPVPEDHPPSAAPGPEPPPEGEDEAAQDADDRPEEGPAPQPGVSPAALAKDHPQPVESLQDMVQKATRATSTRDSIVYAVREARGCQFVGTVQIRVPAGEVSLSGEPQASKREAKRAAALAALRDPGVHGLLPAVPARPRRLEEQRRPGADPEDDASSGSGGEADGASGEESEEEEDGEDAPEAGEAREDEEGEEEDEDEDSAEDDEDEESEEGEEEASDTEEEGSDEDESVPVVASKLRTARWPVAGAEVAVVTGGVAPSVKGVPGGAVAALRVSPDAVAVLRWLEEAADGEGLPRGPSLIVELGCGVGLLGLACAALRPESQAVLTDIRAVLPCAERSIGANPKAIASRVAARKLRFGEPGAARALLDEFGATADGQLTRPVVAVGAAITYWECVYEPLAETLAELCGEGAQVIVGYFRRDWKVERRFWTKLLPGRGLEPEVVWEGEVEPPDDAASCAPVCTRTPGEWNARVYRVSKSASSFSPPARETHEQASFGKADVLALKKDRELRAAETHRQQQLARQAKLASRKKKHCRDTKLGEKQAARHQKRLEPEGAG